MEDLKRIEKINTDVKEILIKLGKAKFIDKSNAIINLESKKEELLLEHAKIVKEIQFKKYSKCNHILVKTGNDSCGCIKCGLDDKVLNYNREALLPFSKNMYDYLNEKDIKKIKGRISPVSCDISLARSIYLHIKLVHPNIDDKTATKYFEIALDNIRNIEVNDERKESRRKRLALSPIFNEWN